MSSTTKIVRPRLGSDSPVPQPRPQPQAQAQAKKDKTPAAAPKKAPVVISVPSQDGSDSSDFSDDEPAVQKKAPAPAPAPAVAATVSQIDKETVHLHNLQDRAKAALSRAAEDTTARDLEHAFDRLAEDYLMLLNTEKAEWVRALALKTVEEQLANLEQYVSGLVAPAPAPVPAQVPAPMEVIEEEVKPAPAAPSKAKVPKAPKPAPKVTPMETDKDGSETSVSEAEDEDEVPEEVTAKSLGLTNSQRDNDKKTEILLGQCATARKGLVEKRNVSHNKSLYRTALANLKVRKEEWPQVKAQRAANAAARGSASSSSSSSSAEGTPVQAPPKAPKAPAAAPPPAAPGAAPTASPSAAPKQQLMVGNLEVLRSLSINGKKAFKDVTPDQMKRFSRSVALFVQAAAFTSADMGRPEPSSLDDISGFLERAADIRHVPTKHFMDAVPAIQAGDKDPLDVYREMVGMHAGLRSKAIKALGVLFPELSAPEPPKDESEDEPEERPAKKQKQK
jgi:hypothetical protein